EWSDRLDDRDLAWAKRQFASGSADLEVVLADGSSYAAKAVIVSIDRRIDRATGTAHVQALVPNPDGRLRPGEFARVRIPLIREGKNRILVPERALVSVQGTFSVAVVGREKKIAMKPLKLGESVSGMRIVESGLDGGEQIVVDNL